MIDVSTSRQIELSPGERCDLCGGGRLQFAYRPPTTVRGLSVFVCQNCGLVQSLPRVDHVASHRVALSSGADWGNIRYGKGFGTDQACDMLSRHIDLKNVHRCLDVGSGRGSFVLKMHELAPHAEIVAIEPDESVVSDYRNIPGLDLIVSRVEKVSLPENHFDLVYCSHTLEHVSSPTGVLSQIRQAMVPTGVLFLEVPNLNGLRGDDWVEEWFIDKHLYHFLPEVLEHYLRITGLGVIEGSLKKDPDTIGMVARKREDLRRGRSVCSPHLARTTLDLIEQYRLTQKENHRRLESAARQIESIASSRPVVVWGAGRIFDCLVRVGELDVGLLRGVIDKHLGAYITHAHGCRVLPPKELPTLSPDIVVIASRAYFEEIRQEISTLLPGVTILGLNDLLKPVCRSVSPESSA